jgi:fermentation-respiration switch protein FrsA (DUF1100 family)
VEERYKKRIRRMLISFVAIPVGIYAAVVTLVVLNEHRFLYFPAADGRWHLVPADTPNSDGVSEHQLTSADGTRIYGWYFSAENEEDGESGGGVILFFHGNASNLANRYETLVELSRSSGMDVFAIDYRGYGKSQGAPSEDGLYQDGRAAWDYLVDERGFSPENIVIFGKSLGGAVATHLATEVDAAGLVVQSSFTSVPDMTRYAMPIVPRFAVRTKMNSVGRVNQLDCPKLFIHGDEDIVIPFVVGEKLAEAAAHPKEFLVVKSAGHNDLELVGGMTYYDSVRQFAETCVGLPQSIGAD